MIECFLALGSNLDSPQNQIESALVELQSNDNCQLLAHSSMYITKPVGPQSQANFINAVVKIATALSPEGLLQQCRELETRHKRVHYYDWGPRTLDVDILLYGTLQLSLPDLKIPHPRMTERDFVLVPLLEIAPELTINKDRALQNLLSMIPTTIIKKLPFNNKQLLPV